MMNSAINPLDDDPYHVVGSPEHTMDGMRVLKRGDTFLVMNRSGEIRRSGLGEQGLFVRGTRHVSTYRLRLDGHRMLPLSSGVASDNLQLTVDLTNPDVYDAQGKRIISYGSLHVARSIFVSDGSLSELLQITNYAELPVELMLDLEYAADFADIFEVRGTARKKHGTLLPAVHQGGSIELAYTGLDAVQRTSRFQFEPVPTRFDAQRAVFAVRLGSLERQCIKIRIDCVSGKASSQQSTNGRSHNHEALLAAAHERLQRRVQTECHIETSNELFNEWLNRSRADLRMLLTPTPFGHYPYAGVPWFSTPFGRDGIWTALQTLWLDPSIARGVLRFLSAHQATAVDPARDAEPGKILHEMRDGEMAELGEVPFKRYYGSVDSTPLYLMLAASYLKITGDQSLIESLWPSLVAAVEWMERYGDCDGDGFIEYGTRAPNGLVQQGWKDSNDAVFHADGSAAPGPIALCEVQGYAYAALSGMANLAPLLGHSSLAGQWRARAEDLKQRFDSAFWCEEISCYALALDGKKRRCMVRTSNAGHCLYTGIVLPERVQPLALQLLSDQMFSGWGVRTLSANEKRYNPMSYHNGSIWPHDNAVLAEGLSMTGHKKSAALLLGALFDVALFMDLSRLPELFCGFARQQGLAPTRYPVACSPQAWASGTAFSLLRAAIGLEVDGTARRVTFRRPVLPPFLEQVKLQRLPVGDGSIDVKLVRQGDDVGLTVLHASDHMEVVIVK